jgi:signal transduction histidine kinase
MAMERDARLSVSAAGAIGAGFALAGLAAAWLAILLRQWGVGASLTLVACAGLALALGALVTLALLARLRDLDRALAALARGETATLSARGWPLGVIPTHLAAASARLAEATARERQAGAYREELTRQTREAAAREERNRLARELHDSIKQQLFGITVSAEAARARTGTDGGAALSALDDIQTGARAAQAEMTALLQQLRPAPLEHMSLVEALRDQGVALGYRTGAEVLVKADALPPVDLLPSRAQEELFRMAQEALANVARHARARHVTVRLERQDTAMLLEVVDDGQGFDMAASMSGMGLNNLRERARALGGVATITSAPQEGTSARIQIPLLAPPRLVTPEEARRQAAVEAASAHGAYWRQWTRNLLMIAGAILLLGLPFWLVALAFVLAGLTYAQGLPSWSTVTRLAGRNSAKELAQRQSMRENLAWLLIGLALCVWYLPVNAPGAWRPGAVAWLAGGVSVALLALGLWSWDQWRQAMGTYFQTLGAPERRLSVERRWQETLGWWTALGIIVALGLFFGHWSPVVPPRTATQWSDTASIALLITLIAFNALETWLVWRWRQATGARESEASA